MCAASWQNASRFARADWKLSTSAREPTNLLTEIGLIWTQKTPGAHTVSRTTTPPLVPLCLKAPNKRLRVHKEKQSTPLQQASNALLQNKTNPQWCFGAQNRRKQQHPNILLTHIGPTIFVYHCWITAKMPFIREEKTGLYTEIVGMINSIQKSNKYLGLSND